MALKSAVYGAPAILPGKGPEMQKILIDTAKNVLWPLGRRLGTAAAAFLVAKGFTDEPAAVQLMAGVGVVAGLAFDVAAAYIYKKKRLS